MEIKFDRMKLKAKEEWDKGINSLARANDNIVGTGYSTKAYDLVLGFVTMSYSERQSLRDFASEFQGKSWDDLAIYAKHDANRWAQMCLKLREDGRKVLDAWDVRRAGKLIEIFPSTVPAKYVKAKITAELVDNEAGTDCDWVVFFGEPKRQAA